MFVKPPASPGGGGKATGLGITGLVLSILGPLALLISLGLFFIISLPMSGAGWACGHVARRRSGDPLGKPAVIIGIVGVVLAVLCAILWSVLFASGFDATDLERELEELQRDLERRSREG